MVGQILLQSDDIACDVPAAVQHYLAHTVGGLSIRALARASNCHPSTILRQVQKCEARRDDPLIDAALRTLMPEGAPATRNGNQGNQTMKFDRVKVCADDGQDGMSQARVDREALHVLRRLCESGAILAVARDMETAVVVREDQSGASVRTAVVDREVAQAIALRDWIASGDASARVARYHITGPGREALRRLTAAEENKAQGFRDVGPRGLLARDDADDAADDLFRTTRYMVTESPLMGLARRRDKDGEPFLDRAQVNVGERLRQDYEISQIGPKVTEDWRIAFAEGAASLPKGARDARARVVAALDDLGPGLQDVVLRCCCFLEGMEITEKKMGWSARSGKIVLRIALSRLIRHYAETQGKYGPMIG